MPVSGRSGATTTFFRMLVSGMMTTDYIDFHATARPRAAALIIDGQEISYSQFARDIRKFTRALRQFELRPGAKVAVDVENIYFHWLLRLAFEQLSVVTFMGLNRLSLPSTFLGDFHLVLSEKRFSAEGIRQFAPTSAWLQAILSHPDRNEGPLPAKGPCDPLRILFTSGTTGVPKRLLYSRRVHEGSVGTMMWFGNFTPQSRYLELVGSVACPTACMRSGGTVVFEQRVSAGEAIASYSITQTLLNPMLLRKILDYLPNRLYEAS